MKGMVYLLITSVSSIPFVTAMGQANPVEAAQEIGTWPAQMILALVAVLAIGACFKMFLLWRKDVEKAQAEAKEIAAMLRIVVAENSVAMAAVNVSNKEVKDAVYHFSSVVQNCEEVRKVAAKKEHHIHED